MSRLAALAAAALVLGVPATAGGHAERRSYFPAFDTATRTFKAPFGSVPRYRARGPSRVVCKTDSRNRIVRAFAGRGRLLRKRLATLNRCRYRHIQQAVDAARSGDRIFVMPGVYREEPSRAQPANDPRCARMREETDVTVRRPRPIEVPTYEAQFRCPHMENLIAVVGDDPNDPDRRCDRRCNLQIEGLGRRPTDVVIENDQRKLNAIRADRADGFYLKNVTLQYSEANNVYVHETNGFILQDLVTRWVKEYGVLSFTSDQGLYDRIDTYGAGDSGVYPGSGPEPAVVNGRCRYGIEIRHVDAHDNNLGYSGTAGNGVWVHHSKFRDNAAGMVTDSIVPGHPGMPQNCAKWERNQISSNNMDIYGPESTRRCVDPATGMTWPFHARDPKLVCSTFPVPVGTGMVVNGNANLVRDNLVYDNWRYGIVLAYLMAETEIRGTDSTGQSDLPREYDVNHDNQITGNRMGVRPDGMPDRNGVDFLWDGEGSNNCWGANAGAPGRPVTYDAVGSFRAFPTCPQGSMFAQGDTVFQTSQDSCLTWDSSDYDNYPPCGRTPEESWWRRPPEPR
ncbi:MAG TPA: hypothetical protein VNB64_08915 [Solirubrobacteraceae bacterium]|nr:hypothetical protein [Solirubrobacteraceae bacterium]